jgi:hypothetical protein
VAPAPASAEPTIADLRELLREGDAPLVTLAAEDGGTLPDADPAPLLDRLGADLPCGTLAARQALDLLASEGLTDARRQQLFRLLEPPTLAAANRTLVDGLSLEWDRSVTSRHALGSRDADRNGRPDLVDAAEADLEHALSRLTARLDWDGPSPTEPLRVVLATSAWRDGSLTGGPQRHLVLPRSLGGQDRLRAIAHQLAHAALEELAPTAPPGWEEAAASFLAEAIIAEALDEELQPKSLLGFDLRGDGRAHPRRALGSPQLGACRGDAAFFAYLDGPLGIPEGWLAETWAELDELLARESRRGPLDPAQSEQLALEALDSVLGRSGSDLATAVSSYLGWSLETELLAGPQVSVDSELAAHPSGDARSGLDLPPFAQLRYAVETPVGGGLRIAFESDSRTEAEVFALMSDGEVTRFPLGTGAWGDRRLRLPGGRLAAVVVLVSAPLVPADLSPWRGGEAAAEGDYRIVVEEDAGYPFVLDEIGVEARVGQTRVDWVTSSEEDLVTWRVERARRLAGPWRRVNAAPMLASSQPDTPWSYSLVDRDVLPSTRYHYRLVGVTSSGLVERTSTVSVLTLPNGPELEGGGRR